MCGEGGEVLFFFSQLKPFLTPIAREGKGRGMGRGRWEITGLHAS